MKAIYFLQKKSIFIICFSFLIVSVNAGPVGKEKAQLVAQNFLTSKLKTNSGNLIKTYEAIMDKTQTKCVMHVFKGDNSYIVVAADDRVYPVLAYSDESSFSSKGKVPAFDWWIENLANSITIESRLKSSVRQEVVNAWNLYSSNDKTPVNTDNSKASVGPLLTTFWSQEGGYNYYCPAFPTGPSGHCVTGCVATATAQVMRYYSYPQQGRGMHSYSHPAFGILSADYGNTVYDWANMGTTTDANDIDTMKRNAIAKLIYHCGVGVDMDYNPTESGSQTELIPGVLYDYFKYRRYINYANRSDYTDDVWTNMVLANLDMHQPLVYSGYGSVGGHAWVCDGYNSPTHFHFNWGWSGASNGYFYLNNLNSGNGDFTSGQGAVFNIVPDLPLYPLCIANQKYTAKNYTFTDGSFTDNYLNNTNCQWLIKPDTLPQSLTLSFLEFKTELNKDILTVYDGETTSSPVLGSFSGQTLPATLTSTSGAFLLVFVTDGTNTDLGWKVKYTTQYLGVEDNAIASQLNVYPNPAHDQLNISGDFKVKSNVKYSVTNIVGATVLSDQINIADGYQNKTIDISKLKAGIYVLTFENGNTKTYSKFVVE